MSIAGPYLPRRARISKAPPFKLTERDITVVEAVYRYRLMTRRQVESLFFLSHDGKKTNTNRARERLRLLYLHAYLERIERAYYPGKATGAFVYRLGPEGAKLVARRTGISIEDLRYWGWKQDKHRSKMRVSPPFLEHSIEATDVRLAIEHSASIIGCNVENWIDETEFRRRRDWDRVTILLPNGRKKRSVIFPDGYFVLVDRQGRRGHFFLEVDRSTETIKGKWQRKILSYKEYILSRRFHRRYMVDPGKTAVRVLTTTPSLARAKNLRAVAEKYGDSSASRLFLFAPIRDVIRGQALTECIWERVGESLPCSIVQPVRGGV